jgi:N-acetyl-anhydromuramyl-L-alanine amidase AmpD
VQTALKLFGYQMPVTGVVDDATRRALISFQNDWNMKATGTITPAVLEALGISAQ